MLVFHSRLCEPNTLFQLEMCYKENILFSFPLHHIEQRKKDTELLGVISLINCEVINIGKQQQFMQLGTKSPPLWPAFANCLHI